MESGSMGKENGDCPPSNWGLEVDVVIAEMSYGWDTANSRTTSRTRLL